MTMQDESWTPLDMVNMVSITVDLQAVERFYDAREASQRTSPSTNRRWTGRVSWPPIRPLLGNAGNKGNCGS